ncbi:hypothetical protein AB0B83_06130 [Micromonospora sp. NPDC049060]|uniref:hypothetical protein n=1 Tax=unclassified Micromonospora TaxID=2617518 RepID=UPI0034044AB3
MREFGYLATAVVFEAPTVLVLLVGLVLTATAGGRLPRKPRLLALSGLGVLLVSALLSVAWTLLLPRAFSFDWGYSNFRLMNLAYGGVQALAYPIGTGLLIAAVLVGRRAGGAAAGPFGGRPLAGGGPVPTTAPVPAAQPVPPTDPGWTVEGGADVPAQWGGRSRPDAPTGAGTDQA